MLPADPKSCALLLDLLVDLLIEDWASDEKRQIKSQPTTEGVAVNDLTEMA
jgi:hypothetical protein